LSFDFLFFSFLLFIFFTSLLFLLSTLFFGSNVIIFSFKFVGITPKLLCINLKIYSFSIFNLKVKYKYNFLSSEVSLRVNEPVEIFNDVMLDNIKSNILYLFSSLFLILLYIYSYIRFLLIVNSVNLLIILFFCFSVLIINKSEEVDEDFLYTILY